MAIPILRSKFRAPACSIVLRRDRLLARLDEAVARPLTLICANAGYGKSTLATSYLAERRRTALWLRLNTLDRQADVLFVHLCAGLAELLPASQPHLAALAVRLGQHHRSPAELAAALVAALDPLPYEPLLIVLDEFEEEREPFAVLQNLHRRAAELYEQSGRYNQAIGHYLAARDYVQAAQVMSQVVDAYPPRTFLRLFDGWLEQEAPDARLAYPSIFIRRVLSLETLERLMPALEEMLVEARSAGDLLRQAHAHHRLVSLPFYRNDTAAALDHYRQSADLFHKLHDPAMEALSLSQMGHLYWLAGDADQARTLCEQSLVLCHRHRLTMPRMHSLWVLAEIALGTGDLARAERLAQAALRAGGEGEEPGAYAYLLLLEFADSPALPAFALENDLYTDYLLTLIPRLPEPALEPVRRLLTEPGQPHRHALAQALSTTQPLLSQSTEPNGSPRISPSRRPEFQTLGRFAVRVGGTDLTAELNRRRSCRRLLFFLLANRHRAIPREQIIEALWPGISPAAGANRFHVALSWLRRILEPGLTSGGESRVIVREGDRYRLAMEVCQVDADEFVRLAAPLLHGRGRRRLLARQEQALTQATAIYHGDFLEDYPYEEFLDGERACLREMQRLALVRLGDHYRSRRQAGRALQWYQAALALDPFREDVHRRMIFAHLLAGDCGTAVRTWQNCATVLRDELGVAPSPTTQALARRWLGVIT